MIKHENEPEIIAINKDECVIIANKHNKMMKYSSSAGTWTVFLDLAFQFIPNSGCQVVFVKKQTFYMSGLMIIIMTNKFYFTLKM